MKITIKGPTGSGTGELRKMIREMIDKSSSMRLVSQTLQDPFNFDESFIEVERIEEEGLDLGDFFRQMRKEGQNKRESNREYSPRILEENKIPFESKNNGAHLVVEGSKGYIDFWPGTGRWSKRDGSKKGFGVRQLVSYILKGY